MDIAARPCATTRIDGIRLLSVTSLLLICAACALSACPGLLPLRRAACEPDIGDVFGNITTVNNPVPAVVIGEGGIPIGKAHTYVYYLRKDHRYHITLSGAWANPATHKTDYDVYVYKLSGSVANFYSSHTESAGLLEQVANDGLGHFFIPDSSATYYLTVRNDALESAAAEQATLMVIEHIETDVWVGRYMEGKVNEKPRDETNWSYEFASSAKRIRVYIDVPDNLDMYEARLYALASPVKGIGGLAEGIPVAWEPGLRGLLSGAYKGVYGGTSGVYGGFNFDPQGFRHVGSMASCEMDGQDMVIDFNTTTSGVILYHLALIAEYGSGSLNFVVQTDFDPPVLQLVDPPTAVAASEPTRLEVDIRDDSGVGEVSCSYSSDGGDAWWRAAVEPCGGGRYGATVPGVPPGTIVDYVFEAEDAMGNRQEARGSYEAIGRSSLRMSLGDINYFGGEEVTPRGFIDPAGREVDIKYVHGDETFNFTVLASDRGDFNHSFTPPSIGEWAVFAEYAGDEDYLPSASERLNFTVESIPTEVSCGVSRERVEQGGKVTISGEFSLEREGVAVELVLKSKDSIKNLVATTSPRGAFSLDFEPETLGRWSIRAKVQSDGLVYAGSESALVELNVVNPSLTTILLRLPSTLASRAGFLVEPPYLYGVIVAVGAAGGGIFFFLRRRG